MDKKELIEKYDKALSEVITLRAENERLNDEIRAYHGALSDRRTSEQIQRDEQRAMHRSIAEIAKANRIVK